MPSMVIITRAIVSKLTISAITITYVTIQLLRYIDKKGRP